MMAGPGEMVMMLEKHKHTNDERNSANILPVLVRKGMFGSKEESPVSLANCHCRGDYNLLHYIFYLYYDFVFFKET